MRQQFVPAALFAAALGCVAPVSSWATPTRPQEYSSQAPRPIVRPIVAFPESGSFGTAQIGSLKPSLVLGERIVLPPNLPHLEDTPQGGASGFVGPGDQAGTAVVNASELGVQSSSPADQTLALQHVIDEAEALGDTAYLPAGTYLISRP